MQIKLVTGDCLKTLESGINAALIDGYRPVGIVQQITEAGKLILVFPMERYRNEDGKLE